MSFLSSFLRLPQKLYFRVPISSPLNAIKFSTFKEPFDGEEIDEPDILLKKLELEVKGHEPAVLKSYESFLKKVCEHFDLDCAVETRHSPIFDRLSMNKSPFIHKKHQRQYEFRSYVKTFTIPNITGCTANVFLEYIQRNLPGGVHMIVKQHRLETLPSALQESAQAKQ